MNELYVKARVGTEIKQWLEASYNSDIVAPLRDSTLMGIIKQHLELTSQDDDEQLDDAECVKIKLPIQNGSVYCQSNGRVYVCNTLWRNRLSEKGHLRVKKFFENNFRHAFHTFMDGYVEGQYATKTEEARLKVKEGVAAFLLQYHIDFNEKLVARLTRDWWRHNDRNEGNRVSPMVY